MTGRKLILIVSLLDRGFEAESSEVQAKYHAIADAINYQRKHKIAFDVKGNVMFLDSSSASGDPPHATVPDQREQQSAGRLDY